MCQTDRVFFLLSQNTVYLANLKQSLSRDIWPTHYQAILSKPTNSVALSHAYIGYGIVLEKAAVLAAIRSDPDYIAMVRKGGLVENYDLSDDESAWRFAIAYVGETRRFNKEHGTGLEEHNVNDNMYIFDCPMDAIHDDEVCEFVAIIDEKATRVVRSRGFSLIPRGDGYCAGGNP